MVDPLLAAYSNNSDDIHDTIHSIDNYSHTFNRSLDTLMTTSALNSAIETNDNDNDSDIQSSLFDQDDDFQSPRSTSSSISSQSSHNSTFININNNSHYTENQCSFGLDADFGNDIFNYGKVCHMSTSSSTSTSAALNYKNEINSDAYNRYLDTKADQFIKVAFFQSNPNINSLTNALNDAKYVGGMNGQTSLPNNNNNTDVSSNGSASTSNNDTFDGISMLNPALSNGLRPEWNFNCFDSNSDDIYNDEKTNSLLNKRFQTYLRLNNKPTSPTSTSSFLSSNNINNNSNNKINTTSTNINGNSRTERNEVTDRLKCQNYFSIYTVPGSSKVFTNSLEEIQASQKFNKPNGVFPFQLSRYDSSSHRRGGGISNSAIGFGYDGYGSGSSFEKEPLTTHGYPSSGSSAIPYKPANSILDLFGENDHTSSVVGSSMFDPELLKTSS